MSPAICPCSADTSSPTTLNITIPRSVNVVPIRDPKNLSALLANKARLLPISHVSLRTKKWIAAHEMAHHHRNMYKPDEHMLHRRLFNYTYCYTHGATAICSETAYCCTLLTERASDLHTPHQPIFSEAFSNLNLSQLIKLLLFVMSMVLFTRKASNPYYITFQLRAVNSHTNITSLFHFSQMRIVCT